MRFTDDGLVLGAGTVLWPSNSSGSDVQLGGPEQRLVALLAAAHLRPATLSGLAHLQKAVESWRGGDESLAAMHLALSGLDRLGRPVADAKRLFFADRLLSAGLDAETLLRALDMPSLPALTKFDPDQPRVPSGSGRISGQWTDGATPSSNPTAAPSDVRPGRRPEVSTSDATPLHDDEQAASLPTSNSHTSNVPPEPAANAEPRHGTPRFIIHLPVAIAGSRAANLFDISWFTDAVKAVGDSTEVIESIAKWRESGPRGELALREAVQARGWIVLGTQVRVQTTAGLRIEDLMVRVPPGTAGNATGYDGFIEVKVNGGRYLPLQKIKDGIIGSVGGTLLTPIPGYTAGKTLTLETGLATVDITYSPEAL
jgi:hypothetical protein